MSRINGKCCFPCAVSNPTNVFEHLEPFDVAIQQFHDNYSDLKKHENSPKCNSCRVDSDIFYD